MTSSTMRLASIAVMALGFGLPASAADTISQQAPAADACTKAVGTMGAVMGHTSEVAPDGRAVYRFLLRTNGLDYDAVCDAATGVVSDVTPRTAH